MIIFSKMHSVYEQWTWPESVNKPGDTFPWCNYQVLTVTPRASDLNYGQHDVNASNVSKSIINYLYSWIIQTNGGLRDSH